MGDTSDIKIVAEPQMDANVCNFIVSRPVYVGMASCKNKSMAACSPLLESLFDLKGVREVMIAGGTIKVAKNEEESWQDLAMNIGTVIRDKMQSGETLISEEQLNKEQPEI